MWIALGSSVNMPLAVLGGQIPETEQRTKYYLQSCGPQYSQTAQFKVPLMHFYLPSSHLSTKEAFFKSDSTILTCLGRCICGPWGPQY